MFSVPDKTADTVADFIIEQIYPRFGCPLQIVSDNGTENVNTVMKETVAKLKIDNVYINLRAMLKLKKIIELCMMFWLRM